MKERCRKVKAKTRPMPSQRASVKYVIYRLSHFNDHEWDCYSNRVNKSVIARSGATRQSPGFPADGSTKGR